METYFTFQSRWLPPPGDADRYVTYRGTLRIPQNPNQRTGFAHFECLIVLMLLGVAFGTFAVGHRFARANNASQLVSFATGIGFVLALATVITILGSGYSAVVSRHHLRSDFWDTLTGFLASSIVVLWCLLALGGIIAIAWRLFVSVFG